MCGTRGPVRAGSLRCTRGHHAPAAVAAVASTSARLQQCGLVAERDPRLGQASEQLTGTLTDATGARQPVVALVLASEGVDLVLVAAGSAARPGAWESLADLALGSACAASGDGCH